MKELILTPWYIRLYAFPSWIYTLMVIKIVKSLGRWKAHPWVQRPKFFSLDSWAYSRTQITKDLDKVLWATFICALIVVGRNVYGV